MLNLLTTYASKVSYYIDPGTGSMIIQILLASTLAGLLILKSWWRKIWNLIRRKHDK